MFEMNVNVLFFFSSDLASLFPAEMSDLTEDLWSLPAVNVVVVNLEYKEDVLPVKVLLGMIFPSNLNTEQHSCLVLK